MERYDLKNKRIAVISVSEDHDLVKNVCDGLHTMGASLTGITPDGQERDGWDAGKSVRFETADPTAFDSLLVITDKAGTNAVMDTVNADHFITSFFDRKRPVSAIGNGTVLLGQLGLLEGRKVSVDSEFDEAVISYGAFSQSASMTTDEGLTTAVSSLAPEEFIQKVAEEVKEGRHEGQHA